MGINQEIAELLNIWGRNTVVKMKRQIDDNTIGHARLLDKFNPQLVQLAIGVKWELILPGYAFYVDGGRPPGKMPPQEAIQDWIDDRGLTPNNMSMDDLNFVIRRYIGTYGLEGKNFYPEFSNRIDDLEGLIYSLSLIHI